MYAENHAQKIGIPTQFSKEIVRVVFAVKLNAESI